MLTLLIMQEMGMLTLLIMQEMGVFMHTVNNAGDGSAHAHC